MMQGHRWFGFLKVAYAGYKLLWGGCKHTSKGMARGKTLAPLSHPTDQCMYFFFCLFLVEQMQTVALA